MDPPENELRGYIEDNGKPMWTAHNNHNIRYFKEEEIRIITNNYDTLLGKGAFGEVYKGVLDDNSPVAVKRYINSVKENFAKEVTVHCQINHQNVVRLIGCCIGENALMIVTEYISKGNLSDILHCSEVSISLETRLGIAIGCAEALSYMHSQMYGRVIHGDIKPANILLDEDLNAKITDFGISTLLSTDITLYTSHVTGSMSYMDPLFLHSGRLTTKSDVYSFGVVLLELITRRRAQDGAINLAGTFTQAIAKQKKIRGFYDVEVSDENNLRTLDEIGKLAARCLALDLEKRPEMKDIAESLRMFRKAQYQKSSIPMKTSQEKMLLFGWIRRSRPPQNMFYTDKPFHGYQVLKAEVQTQKVSEVDRYVRNNIRIVTEGMSSAAVVESAAGVGAVAPLPSMFVAGADALSSDEEEGEDAEESATSGAGDAVLKGRTRSLKASCANESEAGSDEPAPPRRAPLVESSKSSFGGLPGGDPSSTPRPNIVLWSGGGGGGRDMGGPSVPLAAGEERAHQHFKSIDVNKLLKLNFEQQRVSYHMAETMEEISKELMDRDGTIEALRDEYEKLMDEKSKLVEEVEGLRKMKDELDGAKAEADRLRTEKTGAEAARQVAVEKAIRAREIADDLRKEVDAEKAQNRVLGRNIQVLEEQLASAKALGLTAAAEYATVLASFGGVTSALPSEASAGDVFRWMSTNFSSLQSFVGGACDFAALSAVSNLLSTLAKAGCHHMEAFRQRGFAFDSPTVLGDPSKVVHSAAKRFMLHFWSKYGHKHARELAEARRAEDLNVEAERAAKEAEGAASTADEAVGNSSAVVEARGRTAHTDDVVPHA